MTTRDDLLSLLRAAARKRKRAAAKLAEADAELYSLVDLADQAGIAKLTIQQVTGLARQTVYNALKRARR
jgi:hypothetical protein